ncbi:MAG: glycosyltransferase family 39 protein, partial [Planctomycetota bacterium]
MIISKSVNSFVEKNDAINISIILILSLAIGIYLIATTVLIAKDGVSYIERAQKFSTDPVRVIKGPPCGYAFLIFFTYKIVTFVSNNTSVYGWIYSAQCITLLCKLLALIPLYFICKGFVGRKLSFWAILILVLLPYPARFGSDVLRDWPHILFLATGLLFLLLAAKQGIWWMFGIAGLAAGLGHIIRPECAQLVIYGVLWLLTGLLLPKRNMNRPKLICASLVLLIGFAIPAAPYMKVRGKILPEQLNTLVSSCYRLEQERIQEPSTDNHNQAFTTVSLPGKMVKAIGRLIRRISENLMYFFAPALLLGIYSRFGRKSAGTEIECFFMSVFITFNVIVMVLLHYNHGYISRRHCLPLVVLTIFYVPIGLQISADWLRSKSYRGQQETNKNPQLWFFILLAVGAVICLPK